jgi:hypothetical protein
MLARRHMLTATMLVIALMVASAPVAASACQSASGEELMTQQVWFRSLGAALQGPIGWDDEPPEGSQWLGSGDRRLATATTPVVFEGTAVGPISSLLAELFIGEDRAGFTFRTELWVDDALVYATGEEPEYVIADATPPDSFARVARIHFIDLGCEALNDSTHNVRLVVWPADVTSVDVHRFAARETPGGVRFNPSRLPGGIVLTLRAGGR